MDFLQKHKIKSDQKNYLQIDKFETLPVQENNADFPQRNDSASGYK